ncbi:hypothetical protein AB4298_02725 [Shewanella sp. 10N.261.52.F9]|uniref:hypothetical protein n=1 Tax=Shewanella TaxID=22 RepID=UPI00200D6BE5|nr:hypothetical protein [Shewanella marinintestina]MCL1147559.1 hypothetical protein [Shewanella marinintestina]
MSKRYRWIITFASLSLLFTLVVYAVPQNISLKPFSKGNYLLKKGAYDQAAAHWHQLSILFMTNSQQLSPQEMWQSAGLAVSLAAIAADKAQDPIAYQYWADSTRYLLTGGTNWSQLQQQLHQRFETANTQLSVAMQVNDINTGIDASLDLELSALQIWDDKLQIFEFSSPRLGLNRHEQSNVIAPMPYSTEQTEQGAGNKKLSGIETTGSQQPSFTLAPKKMPNSSSQADKLNPQVDSSANEISTAAQQSPMAKGNRSTAQNPQVNAIQRRQIEPVPDTSTSTSIEKDDADVELKQN